VRWAKNILAACQGSETRQLGDGFADFGDGHCRGPDSANLLME